MKKNNAGYVLPLVMIVLAVLCIVAITVMSSGLKNLKNQKAMAEQMQARYAAEGAIECVIASVCDENVMKGLSGEVKTVIPQKIKEIVDGHSAANVSLHQCIGGTYNPGEEIEGGTIPFTYPIHLAVRCADVVVACDLTIKANWKSDAGGTTHNVTSASVTYDTFEITTTADYAPPAASESGEGGGG